LAEDKVIAMKQRCSFFMAHSLYIYRIINRSVGRYEI